MQRPVERDNYAYINESDDVEVEGSDAYKIRSPRLGETQNMKDMLGDIEGEEYHFNGNTEQDYASNALDGMVQGVSPLLINFS